MADKELIRQGSPSIEVYRSNDAAPASWESAKFWITNELRRIQAGFYSTDEVIAALDAKIGSQTPSVSPQEPVTATVAGPKGDKGDPGERGLQGPAGAPADASDLIYDGSPRNNKMWSSLKVRREIDAAIGQAATIPSAGRLPTVGPAPPQSPVSGDQWFDSGSTLELYIWTGSAWVSTTGGNGPNVWVGPNPPQIAYEGDFWFDDEVTAELFMRIGDRWVSTTDVGVSWIDLVVGATPTFVETIPDGDVYEYVYSNRTLYRVIGAGDVFYSSYVAQTPAGEVARKSL